MNYTITTNLSQASYDFLTKEAIATKQTKKAIIEKSLKMYKNCELKKQIEKGLGDRCDEYKILNSECSETQFNSVKI